MKKHKNLKHGDLVRKVRGVLVPVTTSEYIYNVKGVRGKILGIWQNAQTKTVMKLSGKKVSVRIPEGIFPL